VTYGRSVVSSTNKTDHDEITEILLKVALNTINQNLSISVLTSMAVEFGIDPQQRILRCKSNDWLDRNLDN